MTSRDTLLRVLDQQVENLYIIKRPRQHPCPACGALTFHLWVCRNCLNRQAEEYFKKRHAA
ncbi:MAG: hypothetical protein WC497_03885 [Patescibacteria group bacterium]